MEGSHRHSETPAVDRKEWSPRARPGWRETGRRVKGGIGEKNLSMIAGGTAFFLLLSLVPGLAALISIYGLFAQVSDIQAQFAAIGQAIPAEVRTILETQMTRIASERQTAGIAALIGIALALWGAASAMKTVMNALNIIYEEEEQRGYLKLTTVALALTAAFVLIGVVSIGLIVVLPPVLSHVGLGNTARAVVSLVRWPILLGVALVALAILYRYGPSGRARPFRWISPGALAATVLWLGGSALFAFYAQHFGSYNKTYGSLGAIVVLMLWLYISAFAVLLGAEINAESERD